MNAKDWNICLIEPNKFEAAIVFDLLRMAGADKIKVIADSAAAMTALETLPANIIIRSVEAGPVDGVEWTRGFRRNRLVLNRKTPIFLTSHAFSRSLAEKCRIAGVSALIGKPLSGKILTTTINKVLANPRQFVDAEAYVGPCRRAGIVTAGPAKKRRKVDEAAEAAQLDNTLTVAIAGLNLALGAYAEGESVEPFSAALRRVQAYAVNVDDGPLRRACAAFALHLGAKGLLADAAKGGLEACVHGVTELAATPAEQVQERDAIAENVRLAVAKAATLKAA